ncbi:MAG: hypothetical protein M0P69_13475 [Bacteroidales bacterium]|jgi:hypothetical protein|nr:hypothetical protein [Bacteroidales bacterium]MDD2261971.1 hypothetical protein [Clostridia bacterium]MDD2813823.1 hypothetical protein [Bacteroidales bacterium]MDD3972661.1 hypothetical protein [Clostridia bacterium]MDD4813796.1 hypothetical protein [Bacteroidales bacterium]
MKPQIEDKLCDLVRQIIIRLPQESNVSLNRVSQDASLNLYKYGGESNVIPRLDSLIRYCQALNLNLGLVLLLSLLAIKGSLTEDQLFAILKSWDKAGPILERFALIGIQEVLVTLSMINLEFTPE